MEMLLQVSVFGCLQGVFLGRYATKTDPTQCSDKKRLESSLFCWALQWGFGRFTPAMNIPTAETAGLRCKHPLG